MRRGRGRGRMWWRRELRLCLFPKRVFDFEISDVNASSLLLICSFSACSVAPIVCSPIY